MISPPTMMANTALLMSSARVGLAQSERDSEQRQEHDPGTGNHASPKQDFLAGRDLLRWRWRFVGPGRRVDGRAAQSPDHDRLRDERQARRCWRDWDFRALGD